MTPKFELLTQKVLYKFIFPVNDSTSWKVGVLTFIFYFRVTNSKLKKKKFNFELLTQRLNFGFSNFELLTQRLKIKSYILSY